MRTVVARLIHSRSSLSRFHAIPASRTGRCLSTDSNKVDEPFKVEEAETVDVPPPPTEKVLVLGGNGFVGSHICKEALDRGLSVASLSRSGRSSLHDSWANRITWHKGNLLSPDSLKEALTGVTSIVRNLGTELFNTYTYVSSSFSTLKQQTSIGHEGLEALLEDTTNKCVLCSLAYMHRYKMEDLDKKNQFRDKIIFGPSTITISL